MELGLPTWACFLTTFAIATILGMAIERGFFHRLIGQPVFSLIMMTIAISVILRGIICLFWGGPALAYPPGFMPTGTLHLGPLFLSKEHVFCFLFSMALVGGFFLLFNFTKLGLGMKAVSESHTLAHSAGIKVGNIFMFSWIVSCVVSAVGGIFLGILNGLHIGLTSIGLKAIPIVLLGGLESIPGALIAGLIIGFVEAMVSGYVNPLIGGGAEVVVPYIIMIIVLVFRPQGLFGWERIERV